MARLIEIRNYQLKPDMAEAFHRLVQEQSLPMLQAAGVDVVAAQPSLHCADAYVLIRAYSSLAERKLSQDAFYGSAAWLQGPRAAVLACIDSYTTVVIAADQDTIDHIRKASCLK